MRDSQRVREWVKCFNSIASRHNPQTCFRDWCQCFALSLANGVTLHGSPLWERRENQYLEIMKRYDPQDIKVFPELCGILTLAFEEDPFDDYLGRVYMEMFGGNKHLGQTFTPMSLCEVCARLSITDPEPDKIITINDPACGGGAMLIAACGLLKERGINYQRWAKFEAADLDSLCVHMCYIQLSLLGCRGVVYHRDTITMETFDSFITPMEILWPMTLGFESPKDPQPVHVNQITDSRQVVSLDSLVGGVK